MNDFSSNVLRDLFRNPWFYLIVVLASLLFYVSGLVTARLVQPDRTSLQGFLNTDVPEWLRDVPRHPVKKALGNPNAPVTVVEYMDVECPFCKRYSNRIFPRIVKHYVRDGQVYYRIRHFPLRRAHPNAMQGAVAAECAARQDKFWAFKTVALNNRKFLSPRMILELGRIVDVADFSTYRRCVRNNDYVQTVQDEYRQGRRQGVSGTPTVFINGESITGARDYRRYKQAIEEALKADRDS